MTERLDVPVAGGEVPDTNHYTIVMGSSGARAVAKTIVRALQSPLQDPGLRSSR